MTDSQTAPEGGVTNTQTETTGAPNPGTPETTTGNDGGNPDLFAAGWSKASEKYGSQVQAEKEARQKAEAELAALKTGGLNPDELREMASNSETKLKQVQEDYSGYKTTVSDYFANRVKALPEEYQGLMENMDVSDFGKYVSALEKCEALAGTKPKTPPQGGAVTTELPSSVYKEYQEAVKSGDRKKEQALMSNPATKAEVMKGMLADNKGI